MGKRKGDQPNSEASDHAGSEPDKPATQISQNESPAGLAKIDAPELVPPQAQQAPQIVVPAPIVASAPPPVPEPVPASVAAVEPPKVEAPKPEAVSAAPPITPAAEVDDIRPGEAIAPPPASWSSSWASSQSWARARRLTPLAATIAIAAAVGAMAGSIATAGLGHLWASEPAATTAAIDTHPVKDSITRINAELAALKTAIDTSAKSANSQFVKLGDRFDRFERAQAEPAAKLAKLAEAVDRIERRAPTSSTAAAHDITGSVASIAPAPQPAAEPTRPAGPPVLEGWFVRSVYNGGALIQGRLGGVMEVEPGDNLPGLGRVENIRRQDGRWIVVTSRGVIVSR